MSKWKKVKISDSFILQMGKTPSRNEPSFWNNPLYNWVSISDMNQKYICSTKEKISPIALEKTGIKKVPKGTIMLSFKLSLGKVSISALDLYTNEAIMSFFPKNKNEWNIDFLYNYFKWLDWGKKAQKAVKGSTLNKNSLGNIEIPLPPMEEQKKIAARLDAVSDLLAKQKQLLSEQDTLIQSTFYDMFGDPIKNNKGWKIEKFKELGTLERGKSQHRPRNAPELLGGPYPLIQTGDIAQTGLYLDSFSQTYSELGLKQSRLWKKGTLCITIAANIAKTSILNFDACFPDSVVGFVNNTSCNIMFIQIWMSFLQKILENNAPQAAQKNINLEILGNLNVIVPPLELQEKFAAVAEQIESEKSKIKSAIAETQTLFNALMSEYFEE